jgi:hypothetical protein
MPQVENHGLTVNDLAHNLVARNAKRAQRTPLPLVNTQDCGDKPRAGYA